MNGSRFHFLVLLLFTGACSGPTPGGLSSSERAAAEGEVRAAVEEVTAAMNAHDPDRLFALYLQTDEFVYVGCTEPLFGFGGFSARVGPYYRTRVDVVFEQEILALQVMNPTSAVATLRGSSTEAEFLFWTLAFVKAEDGRWLIAHEHESWPGCSEPSPLHPTGVGEGLGGTL